jgi:hypothetical protein
MSTNCLLHNTITCGKRKTIERYRLTNHIKIVYGYDWESTSDNIVLIYELINKITNELSKKFPVKFEFQSLGGKDGSIYCDICRQIKQADVAIFDLSKNNLNVIFELGLAIGIGTYVFMLRSTHYKKQSKGISDLNGILEYRFSRHAGRLQFQSDFKRSLIRKLISVAKKRLENLDKNKNV